MGYVASSSPVRRRFADLRRTLLDCGREMGIGARVNAAVYRICIEDPPGISTSSGHHRPSRRPRQARNQR